MPTRKLIEVALPLDDINAASAREKSIRHGHPSTLHLWWARRPLAACRAVLFASLVDDPDQEGVPSELLAEIDRLEAPELPDWRDLPLAEQRRQRLFRFIKTLVQWESSTDERVLATARRLIHAATNGNPPPVYDPFAGGGSIPLEAQRLGLEAHASDLNPVAVLINKALIEIPPKFAGMPPVNPIDRNQIGAEWKGAAGLAADVRYYGKWMRDEAEKRIGHLYPKVKLPKEHGGGEATVIAWLWARTVICPNPACGGLMHLISSFELSKKPGQEAWVEPIVDHSTKSVRFSIKTGNGNPPTPPKIGRGARFRCLICGESAEDNHIKKEARAGRMSAQMIAKVVEGHRVRIFLPANQEDQDLLAISTPVWTPSEALANDPRAIWCVLYGLDTFDKLFNQRQLIAITQFVDLINEVTEVVERDILDNQRGGRDQYTQALATYLMFAVNKMAEGSTTICTWSPLPSKLHVVNTFGRQALPMAWDYAEANVLGSSAGNFSRMIELVSNVIERQCSLGTNTGTVLQQDAANLRIEKSMISTDPPYYDNIGYADLSDFFYVWMRRALRVWYPDLFDTLLVPKTDELVAAPYRFDGDRKKADIFFEKGLREAFLRMQESHNREYPLTVYYAFKQAENNDTTSVDEHNGTASTGWETMLEGLIQSGFTINGTWPVRTERSGGFRNKDANALATSIVLVCRPRPEDARSTTRLEFIRMLRRELPSALRALQHANIAPVDLAQAAIGPGMAIYSRYRAVLEADGAPMRVRTALQLINQALDEVLSEQEGAYDADTRWAIAWFEQHAFDEGLYGVAETLSKAKNTSVQGMVEAGVAAARAGKVRLLRRDELPEAWNPSADARVTAWEATQHLVRALDTRGEAGAASVLAALPGGLADTARDLAYRLYTTCERKKWAQEALAYNALVIAWPEIARLAVAQQDAAGGPVQGRMEL